MALKTRVMVLGTTHLGRGAVREPEASLESIRARIARWAPDAIAIEVLPGEVVDVCLRLGGPTARGELDDVQDAAACADAVRELHSWTLWEAREIGQDVSRSTADRVIAWCAAYEPFTALLLARAAGQAGDLPASSALESVAARGDERSRVGVEVAVGLGLERLHPFDDHADWSAMVAPPAAESLALHASLADEVRRHPVVADWESDVEAALREGDLWPLWRARNSPELVASCEELESGYLVRFGKPEHLALRALGAWRARNLLMAGRLMDICSRFHGGRVLALVGVSHKGPIEAALATSQWGIELAPVQELD